MAWHQGAWKIKCAEDDIYIPISRRSSGNQAHQIKVATNGTLKLIGISAYRLYDYLRRGCGELDRTPILRNLAPTTNAWRDVARILQATMRLNGDSLRSKPILIRKVRLIREKE